MKKIFCIFVLVAFAAGVTYAQCGSESGVCTEAPLEPEETTDTETEALGIPNRLVISPFNIFINPAAIILWIWKVIFALGTRNGRTSMMSIMDSYTRW